MVTAYGRGVEAGLRGRPYVVSFDDDPEAPELTGMWDAGFELADSPLSDEPDALQWVLDVMNQLSGLSMTLDACQGADVICLMGPYNHTLPPCKKERHTRGMERLRALRAQHFRSRNRCLRRRDRMSH